MNKGQFSLLGIDEEGGVSRLIVNDTARSVVAVLDIVSGAGLPLKRLYYRHFDEPSYHPLTPLSALESQDDAHSSARSSDIVYLSRIWSQSTDSETWSNSRPDIWRLDLTTGKRDLVLQVDKITVMEPSTRVILAALHGPTSDAPGVLATLGLLRQTGQGATVHYGVFAIDFATAAATRLTSLSQVFL